MADYIKCAKCRFAQPDRSASYGKWIAYECSNPKSNYYKSLLNITRDGAKLPYISWNGCAYGEACEGSEA